MKLVFETPDGDEVHFERVIKPAGAAAESLTSEVRAPGSLQRGGAGARAGETEASPVRLNGPASSTG